MGGLQPSGVQYSGIQVPFAGASASGAVVIAIQNRRRR